jgi:hypothetical protein
VCLIAAPDAQITSGRLMASPCRGGINRSKAASWAALSGLCDQGFGGFVIGDQAVDQTTAQG